MLLKHHDHIMELLKPPGKPWRPSCRSTCQWGIKWIQWEETYLGGEELGENVGEDTTLRDDDGTEELVKFFIVSDGELQVSGYDTGLFVVSGSVTCEFEDLGSEVLEDSGEVDGGTGTDSLGVVSLLQESVDTTDGDW
jgi:hypothetical protein